MKDTGWMLSVLLLGGVMLLFSLGNSLTVERLDLEIDSLEHRIHNLEMEVDKKVGKGG